MKSLIISTLLLVELCSCSSSQKSTIEKPFLYLTEFKNNCEKGKEIWGKDLCVPMLFLDRETMTMYSTHQSPAENLSPIENFYKGKYTGPSLYANTSLEWEGKRWSMVLLPLPKNKSDRMDLVMHEAFHSIQSSLGLSEGNAFLTHLDKYEGRLLIRLEWNALYQALVDENNRKDHLSYALRLRGLRFRTYKKAQDQEELLETSEGLAAYTGIKFRTKEEQLTHLEEMLDSIVPKGNKQEATLTRSAAYLSGPLYGLLLDLENNEWKRGLKGKVSLAQLAQSIYNLSNLTPFQTLADLDTSLYSYEEILAYEKTRKLKKRKKLSTFMRAFESEQRLVLFPAKNSSQMFDPRKVLTGRGNDLIFEQYEVMAQWGHLQAKGGVLATEIDGERALVLSPPLDIKNRVITGKDWKLKMKKGWSVKTQEYESKKTLFLIKNR